jgi:hypothetical protein
MTQQRLLFEMEGQGASGRSTDDIYTSRNYYPYVHPPLGWVKQALLYWDQVSSIVGDGFYPDHDLEWLMDKGIFRPLGTHDLRRDSQEKLRREIMSRLEWAEANGDHLDVEAEAQHLDLLIRGKLPVRVEKEIRRRRLIVGKRDEIPINSDLLELLTSTMARHLADSLTDPYTRYTVHTTERRYFQLGFDPFVGTPAAPGINLILRDFLPVPDESTSFEQVIDFRESHRKELLAFRRALDTLYSRILDEGSLETVLPAMREEMELALNDIRQGLVRSKIRWLFGSVSVLLLSRLSMYQADTGLEKTQFPWVFDGLGTNVVAFLIGASVASSGRRSATGDFGYLLRAGKRFHSF